MADEPRPDPRTRRPRIALLIDADNSPASKIDDILNELSGYGETSVRRAYGNWTKAELNGWAEVLHDKAIRPIQQYDYSKGKNASDMALVIDAMALLYTDAPDAYGIVSSDADFTPLVMHLREKGAAVYGFGAKKTPKPFVSACSRFLFLDQLGEDPDIETDDEDEAPKRRLRVPTAKLRQDAALVRLLRNAVTASAGEDGWALVGTVGQHISNQSSFDPRNYGYVSLSKLLAASQLFEFRDEGTGAVAVRDKRAGKGS
ncbi:MAG TPA: NYN domain-containing protein [Marmoricola sp.]|nr:NYN domain-containing protein [Marmoricola sp.]